MSNQVSDLAKSIIEDYEGNQGDIAAHEAMNVRFTASLKYDDLALLDALSQHYSGTRTELVTEILSNMAVELFMSLPDSKKSPIADSAEQKCKEHEKKNNFESHGVCKWAFMANEMAKKGGSDA